MMAFFGLFNVYALRVNLSVAIVAMTEIRTVTHANGSTTNEQYFPWDSIQKGYVLSSFFYGYLCTQVIGGIIAQKIGGSLVRREKKMIITRVVDDLKLEFSSSSLESASAQLQSSPL